MSAVDPRPCLVTGFNDWPSESGGVVDAPGGIWACDRNPSGRLLVGAPRTTEAERCDGPLPQWLATEAAGEGPFEFRCLPTVWEIGSSIPWARYRSVVMLGLGVYDGDAALQLELGALNRRRNIDAAGAEPKSPEIDAERRLGERLDVAADHAVRVAATELDSTRVGRYTVRLAEARESNAYLCNETHYRGLRAVLGGDGPGGREGPLAAWFLHIPQPPSDDAAGWAALAEGVGLVTRSLARLR